MAQKPLGAAISPRAYYWYLTFEDSRELRSLVSDFQERIVFPYYDLTRYTTCISRWTESHLRMISRQIS